VEVVHYVIVWESVESIAGGFDMSTLTHKPTIYDRQPGLRISPEELKKRNERLLKVLQSFEEGDAEEQRETGDFLMKALAEARESNRECFKREAL